MIYRFPEGEVLEVDEDLNVNDDVKNQFLDYEWHPEETFVLDQVK